MADRVQPRLLVPDRVGVAGTLDGDRMTLVDRFICRREGHKPTATLTGANPFVTTYITSCQRCGKFLELTSKPPPPAPAKPLPPMYRGPRS